MLFGIPDVDPVNLRNNTLELAEAAVAFDVPVILTTSNPTAVNGPRFAELTDLLPDAPIIDRTAINAWDDPAFVDAVRATGRHQLVMAGVTVDVLPDDARHHRGRRGLGRLRRRRRLRLDQTSMACWPPSPG